MRVSFRIKLLASHAAVALAVSAVTLLVVERAVSRRMEAQVDRRLEIQAHAVSRWLEQAGRHPNRLAGRLAGVVAARVTIIDANGVAVGDSTADPSRTAGTNAIALTPEVREARDGRVGRATRESHAGRQVRYVAVPAPNGAVVRLGLPIDEIDDTKAGIRRQLVAGAIASLIVAVALAFFVAGALTRRLFAARELARRIGAGDYDVSVQDDAADEVSVLSNTLVAAASELKETEARRREFLANVAHEIRTPVTSIRGYAETLDRSDVDADTRGEFLDTIHRNAVRIGQLVEDLLELEALQAGKSPPLSTETVRLAPIARAVARTVQARADELDASVAIDVDDELACAGDADAVERIVLNLVDNALRHGGRGVHVAVDAERRGNRVRITVRDDGPGIPEAQRSRIFERFFRGFTAGDRDGGGSGLGLAISRELAQAMGGSLSLGSEADTGTAFSVDLPAVA